MKQGRETWDCYKTAVRLRKPESGTEVDVTATSYGASPRDVVLGVRNLRELV